MEKLMELSKRSSSELMRREVALACESDEVLPGLTVALLERALLAEFPSSDAEPWDRTGLQVGDPRRDVTKVAVALDATVEAIECAAEAGANVLVTHHPPFLSAPDAFRPAASVAEVSGAGVWAAIRNDVALMCFHTALDVSPHAAVVLPSMLGLDFTGRVLEPAASQPAASSFAASWPADSNPASSQSAVFQPVAAGGHFAKGYGQLCAVRESDEPFTLGRFAARCTAVFGRAPRVWGDFDREMSLVATATGSAGGLVSAALEAGVDCLACGEIKYHEALDASRAGLAIIDLGHDTSELPLVRVLADAVVRIGVDRENVVMIDQSANWTYPDAVRV